MSIPITVPITIPITFFQKITIPITFLQKISVRFQASSFNVISNTTFNGIRLGKDRR